MPTNTVIYDIETIRNTFLYMDIDYKTREEKIFLIGEFHNDLVPLVDYLKNGSLNQVGFNNLSFDSQVVQYIIENYDYWVHHDHTGEEINNDIYKYTQTVIAKQDSFAWADYPSWKLTNKQLDLYKLWHFDNQAKRTSLKWVQYSMDWHNLQDMPIEHGERITLEQIPDLINYCRNDILSTDAFFNYTLGRTDHPLYKGIDKLQLRKNIKAKFKLDCLNFNDVKIGDEMNKQSYLQKTGMSKYELKDLKKTIGSFTYKECIPNYVSFRTPQLQEFYEEVKDKVIDLNKKQNHPFTFYGTNYVVAKGGIHSEDKPRIVRPTPRQILRDADIGSQYPNGIRKRKLFPRHLGPEWLEVYCSNITGRLDAKAQFKVTGDKTFKSIDELMKLALNGGGFGKTGEPTSWQYDPFISMSVTIGNQFEILMLIESLELAGIHVISANTDGVVCLFDKSLEDKYIQVCKEWERIVGNHEQGMLEYTEYELLVQMSVNDYIALKPYDEKDAPTWEKRIKTKGDFLIDSELHKNKSNAIVRKALMNYYIHGTSPSEFIRSQRNIYDFCSCVRLKSPWKLVGESMVQGELVDRKCQKTVRYYMSKHGEKLVKVNPDGRRILTESVTSMQTEFNLFVEKPWEEYDIDYKYYIDKTYNIINSINPEITSTTTQLNLFAA